MSIFFSELKFHFVWSRIHPHLVVYNWNFWNAETLLVCKWTAWTVQYPLDNLKACMPLTQDCPPLLIISNLDIIKVLLHIVTCIPIEGENLREFHSFVAIRESFLSWNLGGVVSFGMAKANNLQKFSLWNHQFAKVFSLESFLLYGNSLWLAFLTSIQQGRTMEFTFAALNSINTHYWAYRKYTCTESLQNMHLYSRHAALVVPMVSTLERLLQSFLEKEFYLQSWCWTGKKTTTTNIRSSILGISSRSHFDDSHALLSECVVQL